MNLYDAPSAALCSLVAKFMHLNAKLVCPYMVVIQHGLVNPGSANYILLTSVAYFHDPFLISSSLHFLSIFKVGLALVVNGKVTVGVMGCPNWTNDDIVNKKDDSVAACNGRGILMVSHIGCGTWSRRLSADIGQFNTAQDIWKRCFVDTCSIAHMAHYCIPDSQTWDMIPLSATYDSTTHATDPRNENEILLLSVFCGRFVALSNLH